MNELMKRIRKINDKNGWLFLKNAWDDKYFLPTKLLLVITEVVEAVEAFRNHKYYNFNEEMADIFIRLLDICSGMDINIVEEINKKLDVLEKRPFRHGNKKI
jgi:NTP pyrophosphatase (non-canonical NTP hydrolase)